MLSIADQKNLWFQICADPSLVDIPYKIETDENGTVMLTDYYFPATDEKDFDAVNSTRNIHGDIQTAIAIELSKLSTNGRVSTEYAVITRHGTRDIDVCWRQHIGTRDIGSVMPDVCIEIWSPGNRKHERETKPQIYFEAGAKEVWTCTDGAILFFEKTGQIRKSKIFPGFPLFINL